MALRRYGRTSGESTWTRSTSQTRRLRKPACSFADQGDDATFVSITESGWTGNGDELVEYATNATQGFTWTLAGLKAFLEHNLQLNLVADRYPKGPGEPYPDG